MPDRPKVLARVGGRPFLAHLLDRLAAAGIRRVVLCTGFAGDQVQAAFGSRYGLLGLQYSREPEPLGTAGALAWALPCFDSECLLVMNGDSLCDADLAAYWTWHRQTGADVSLLLTRCSDASRYGSVLLDEGQRIVRFEEKKPEAGTGWINAGVYLIARRRIREIPTGRPVSLETEMLPAWIPRGVRGLACPAPFIDIGTPDSYTRADAFIAAIGLRMEVNTASPTSEPMELPIRVQARAYV